MFLRIKFPRINIFLLFTAYFVIANISQANEKITQDVQDTINTFGSARVIVIAATPGAGEPASAAFVNTASFLTSTLGEQIKNVSGISDLPLAVGDINTSSLQELRNNPFIERVVVDALSPPLLENSEKIIGAGEAHSNGYAGSGYSVAVLDSGADISNPFLDGKMVAEACFSTAESSIYDLETLCPNGLSVDTTQGAGKPCTGARGCDHGTHVAGISVGKAGTYDGIQRSGIAPDADLISLQVFTKFNDSRVCGLGRTPCIRSFTSDQIKALRHVRSLSNTHKIAAANMSLGGGRHETACDATEPLSVEINQLRNIGISTVVASGNNGFFNAVSSPACISTAITVTASTNENDTKVDTEYANVSSLVDYIAPGTDIMSSVVGGFELNTGTSMAAPHVAGAIAVIKSTSPTASVADIENALTTTSSTIIDPRSGQSLNLINITEAIGMMKNSAPKTMVSTAASSDGLTGDEILELIQSGRLIITIIPDSGTDGAAALGSIVQKLEPGTKIESLTEESISVELPQNTSDHKKAEIVRSLSQNADRLMISPNRLSETLK